MPRYAHGRPLLKSGPSKPSKRKPKRNAALNALETAEAQNLDSIKIPQHRLGEIEDDSDNGRNRADTDGRSNKRRKVTNEQNDDDIIEEGSDLEGGTWHTGVNEDEDSDIDSDEAFGDSDEEKFGDFTFRGSVANKSELKRKRTKITKEFDLNEEIDEAGDGQEGLDQDESDDLGDEAVDLATAWDMDDMDELETQRKDSAKPSARALNGARRNNAGSEESETPSGDADGSSENSEVEDDESQFSISDEEMDGDTAGLRTFVEGLSSSKAPKASLTRFDSKTLPKEPSSFGLPPSKLSAADLLQYIKDPTHRQSLKILQNAERSGPEQYKGGIPGKLSAPLAKRQQDRLDRGAAYEKSKETLNRWVDTVKQNRRAEHLSFPLADQAKESATGQKQLAPTTQSAPLTQLEAAISEIMQESGMGHQRGQTDEDHEQAFEELAEKKMDIEDVKARRAELRMARELMFREEVRAKRIKKIKSKAYRRVHRKERDRQEARQREALEAAGLLNSDDEREKQDRRRAEERMGARHRESRWAKSVKQVGRATWDEDARAGVTDLARRDEELRRRILGKDVANPEASDQETDSDTDYDADSDAEGKSIAHKIALLENTSGTLSKSKIGQMAFMQRAEAAQKADNDEEIRQLRLAMDDNANGLTTNEEEIREPTGRQKFGMRTQLKSTSQNKRPKGDFEAFLSEDDDERELQDTALEPAEGRKTADSRSVIQDLQMQKQDGSVKLPRFSHTKSSADGQNPSDIKRTSAKKPQTISTALDDYTSPSESEDDARQNMGPDEKKAALATSIFAGPDDAVQEFTKEKQETVKEEGDQIIDNTLPGWGSWAGAGISKREQKKSKGRFLTTVKGVAPEKRQDAKLDRVIINEKRVKKNGKYLATELPHPFETRQQYERSLRLPMGPEWSTTNHYQDSIKPRVILKQGTVIRPIAKPIA